MISSSLMQTMHARMATTSIPAVSFHTFLLQSHLQAAWHKMSPMPTCRYSSIKFRSQDCWRGLDARASTHQTRVLICMATCCNSIGQLHVKAGI